jgi:hypothetical protein
VLLGFHGKATRKENLGKLTIFLSSKVFNEKTMRQSFSGVGRTRSLYSVTRGDSRSDPSNPSDLGETKNKIEIIKFRYKKNFQRPIL